MEDKDSEVTIEEIDIQWCDTNTYIQVGEELVPAGTCLKINNTILFLKAYRTEDLLNIQNSVNNAVMHELEKRRKKI
jgi:hypothetical protein